VGNPLKFILSAGQQHDIKAVKALIEGIINSDVFSRQKDTMMISLSMPLKHKDVVESLFHLEKIEKISRAL